MVQVSSSSGMSCTILCKCRWITGSCAKGRIGMIDGFLSYSQSDHIHACRISAQTVSITCDISAELTLAAVTWRHAYQHYQLGHSRSSGVKAPSLTATLIRDGKTNVCSEHLTAPIIRCCPIPLQAPCSLCEFIIQNTDTVGNRPSARPSYSLSLRPSLHPTWSAFI